MKGRDLLKAPLLGTFLRWRHARTLLQLFLLAVAVLVIVDGLFGPQPASGNLAGILPWVHWRGFVALGLLLMGNFFCMACPFMLPRRIARVFSPAKRHWPKRLRSKWLALVLLFLFFWSYEALHLWESPWLTAWLVLAYFAAAFLVDSFFRGAPFCKYVCPIGHFHFVNSLVAPMEVAIREPGICATCATRECIVGVWEKPRALGEGAAETARALRTHERGKLLQNGCELWLYQETKRGNMDCTFCLECVHACPHDNIGILTRAPGRELWEDPIRAGVGRFSQRPDLAALVLFLIFSAFMNAFGATAPASVAEGALARLLGLSSGPLTLGILFSLTTLLLPAILVGATAKASVALSGSGRTVLQEAVTYTYALVPIGFGMWTAHYLHHFLLGGLAIVPAIQKHLAEFGVSLPVSPGWTWGPLVPESWLLPMGLFLLAAGSLLSAVAVFRIARRVLGAGAVRGALPWWGLNLALFGMGVWVLLQPLEMRGVLPHP